MPDRHLIRTSALAAALLVCLAPHRSVAQSTTTLLPDATVPAQGAGRIRLLTSWTRWDNFLGDGGTRNIGSLFSTDTLGTLQMPRLASIEADIRAVSGLSNFRLTAGNVVSSANSRVMTAPLIGEYGLTNRLAIGVAIPFVQARSHVFAQLNPTRATANVGVNPVLLPASNALAQNAAFVQSIRNAASLLQSRINACIATPSGTGCSTLLAQQQAAQLLMQNSNALATQLEALYGTDRGIHRGQPFVPTDSSTAQAAVRTRIGTVTTQYRTLLDTNVITGFISAAAAPGANAALQGLLTSVGRDTVRSSPDRTSIGDISVGVTFQLLNSLPSATDTAASWRGLRYRVAVNGTFRIGTGQPANRNRLFDVGTGYGQNGIEIGAATDLLFGRRVSATALGFYTKQLGTIDINRVPNAGGSVYPLGNAFDGTYSAGDVMQLVVNPRYRLGGFVALTGHYSFVRVGEDKYTLGDPIDRDAVDPLDIPPVPPFGFASQTSQQLGIGFSYTTTVGRDRGPGAIPIEVLYSHYETIAGGGGPTPKVWRDQVELRIFLGRKPRT